MKRLAKTKVWNAGSRKARPFRTFNDGYGLGSRLTKDWNSKPNPPKVYIGGYRIHHGLVGAALTVAGILSEKPALVGLGASLALDDIADMPDWLNFENGKPTQHYLPQWSSCHSGFA
ncbi:hypothetical protein [Candidatus Nitrosotenuis uzonensis]|uniref:Uncharacterized protein n=1 Tax=Candidatus Nitrosotenuis uzonensis TaxID=1407055 RepID=V6ASM7_9ARCH|nr:hypothetical protein [Candidatus Nitrosotenuis uzonensis]CDI05453.1 hypothetical protein NITUZ_30145 [Candidatus Nitrosotenuis uzonensis]